MDATEGRAVLPQAPQGAERIHVPGEDGEIMCVQIKEEEIPADISPLVSVPFGTRSQLVKNRTSGNGRSSIFLHTRKRPSATRMSDSRGYIEVNSLITAVSHQPAIWDARDPHYLDRLKRSHAWERVCKEVTDDWDDLHAKTRDRRLKDLQTRWRSLKDCYRRELQQQRKAEKSGGPTIKRKTYLYFRQLHFLKPVLEARREVWKQKSGGCLPGNLRAKNQESQLGSMTLAPSATTRSGAPSVPLMESPNQGQLPKRRRQEKQSSPTLHPPTTSTEVVREHQELEKDADYHFYMYIMAVTKKFSPEKKWAFRMKIMELLQMHSLDQQADSSFLPQLNYSSSTPETRISPSSYPPVYPHYPYDTSHPLSSRSSPTPTYIPSTHEHNPSDSSILPIALSRPHSPIESPCQSPLSRSSQTLSSQASLDTEGDSSLWDY